MDRSRSLEYDAYLPSSEEEQFSKDVNGGPGATASGRYEDLSGLNSSDPNLDDESRNLLRLAAGEELEEFNDSFYDASDEVKVNDITPDSGVHDLSALDPEERARLEQSLKEELARTEEEIQTLRLVLSDKVKYSQELKRKLGISVWKELKEDLDQGLKNIQDSTAYKDVSGRLLEWNSALTSAPIYQKTTTSIKVAGEKTTSVLGTFGASVSKKLGEMKNSTTYKSFEEKVGSAYTNVRSKVSSRSNSTHSFEEALNSRDAHSASVTPATSPIIPEEKPLS